MNNNRYFYRNVIFSKQGKTISLIDIHQPDNPREELDPWYSIVLQLADGQHTIEQLLLFMADQYNGAPPENLQETIHSVIQRMSDNKLVVLTEKPTELPYYLSKPYELLDVEKAKKILEEDRLDLQ